jgi:hypothetical protein
VVSQVLDLVDALGELPAVRGALVAVVVDGVVEVRAAVTQAPELCDVGTADRGVARKLDRARVHGLHGVVPETSQPLDPGADLLPADELDVDVGHPPGAVVGEQRREAVVVAHHSRVGELAAQRLDLDAVSDGLKVAHRVPPLSVLGCLHDWRSSRSVVPPPLGGVLPRGYEGDRVLQRCERPPSG